MKCPLPQRMNKLDTLKRFHFRILQHHEHRLLIGRGGPARILIENDLAFAYRHIAFPFAITVGAIVLVLSLLMEVRNYRQRKTLAGIERAS